MQLPAGTRIYISSLAKKYQDIQADYGTRLKDREGRSAGLYGRLPAQQRADIERTLQHQISTGQFALANESSSAGPNAWQSSPSSAASQEAQKAGVPSANTGGGSPPLAPGSGTILTLYFQMGEDVPVDVLSPVDTFSILNFHFEAETKSGILYVPVWEVGGVDILNYCRGDFNLGGGVDAADIIALVGHVFKSAPGSPDPWTMDVDLNGDPTAQDIIFLVNYVFKSGTPPE